MKNGSLFAGAAAAALTAFAAPPALAQDDDAELTQDVITITSRKREETLLETPISVSAYSAETLEAFGAFSARDIADLTPGLQINGDFGRTGERPVIRGIANLRAETPQPVGLFIDGVYVRTGIISSILDSVERVEVLKGPQGALYGRSTYGGVVNYISQKPADELSGVVAVSYAEHDQLEVTGKVSIPLGEHAGLLIGGRHYEYGGEYDNVNANSSGARDVGSEETQALYAFLNIEPTDRMEINIRGFRTEDTDGQFAGVLFDSTNNNSVAGGGTACPTVVRSYYCGEAEVTDFVDIATSIDAGTDLTPLGANFPSFAQWDFRAGLDRSTTRLTGDFSYDLTDNITFLYQGGYTEEEARNIVNQSYSGVVVSNPFASGFPSAWVTDDIDDRSYSSHEARLNGSIGDQFTWLAGAFYYDEESRNIGRNILESDLTFGGASTNTESAFFGGIDWEVVENLSIGLEGRAYEEDVSSDVTADGETGKDLEETFDGFTWRVTVDYTLPNDVLLYASASEGNKSGGFNSNIDPNDPNPDLAALSSFDEELALQYELGVKGQFMGGRGTFELAGYMIELTDQQLSQVVQIPNDVGGFDQVTVVLNVGETEITGLEGALTFNVNDIVRLGGSYAWADSEITEGSDETHGGIVGDESLVGFKVPRVSEHSANIFAEASVPLGTSWEGSARLDGIYASSRYAQVHNLQETGDSYRANLRLTAANQDTGTELVVWGRNIFDDDTASNVLRYVDPADFRFFARAYVSFLPRGQQFGATIRQRF